MTGVTGVDDVIGQPGHTKETGMMRERPRRRVSVKRVRV
jgi:hypothetical protein